MQIKFNETIISMPFCALDTAIYVQDITGTNTSALSMRCVWHIQTLDTHNRPEKFWHYVFFFSELFASGSIEFNRQKKNICFPFKCEISWIRRLKPQKKLQFYWFFYHLNTFKTYQYMRRWAHIWLNYARLLIDFFFSFCSRYSWGKG